MYSIFRFSQKPSKASRLLSTKKRDLLKTKASGRPDAGDFRQSSQRMLGNNRLSREKMIKPWLSPLLGEKVDATQVLSICRSPHKRQQLIAPFAAQALVEHDLFLGIGKTVRRDDQQIIRTNHRPVFQATKLTSLFSRGDAWAPRWKQVKNNPTISAFYQNYRLYSSLPRQEKKTVDEGAKIKGMRPEWTMFLGALGVLLLLVFIYKMKNPLVFADTNEEDDFEQLINAVMALQAQGDNTGAIEMLTAYITQYPQSTYLWVLYSARGDEYYANGDLDKALLDYDAALATNPKYASGFSMRGIVWSDKGDLDKALKDYDAALSINPEDTKTLNNRGNVWSAKGDLDKALKDYDAVLALNSEDAEVLNNRGLAWQDKGDLDNALKDYNAALAINPEDARALNDRGNVWSAKGDLDKALLNYDAVLKINPQDGVAFANRGSVWHAKGDLDKALSDCDAALAINPNDNETFNNRGSIWYAKGDLDKALSDCDAALAINPKGALVFNNRGLVWHAKGDLEKALADYDAALKINPQDGVAFANRGSVWRAKGDLDKALSDYNAALAINPNDNEAFNNRGSVWYAKGDLDKALKDYNVALAINPKNAAAFSNRGMVWCAEGEWDKGLKDYNKALDIKPDIEQALFGRGIAYQEKGELKKARENYEKGLACNPECLGAIFNLAVLYMYQGALDESEKGFERVLSLDDRFQYTKESREGIQYIKRRKYFLKKGKPSSEAVPKDSSFWDWIKKKEKTPKLMYKQASCKNSKRLEALRVEQIRLSQGYQQESNPLMEEIERGDKKSIDKAIADNVDLENPKVIVSDKQLIYRTPVFEAREQWFYKGREKDRYAIFETLIKNRCVSHTCFNREELNKSIAQDGVYSPEKVEQPLSLVQDVFTEISEDVKKEAALNLHLSVILGKNWADLYHRGKENLAITLNHPHNISVARNEAAGYTANVPADGSQGDPLGWKIRDALLLRFKAYYLTILAYDKIKHPTEQRQKEQALLKEETVILQTLFRDTDVTLRLYAIPDQVAEKKTLTAQHAKNMVQRIKKTKNKEYMIWSGYKGHTLFVDVIPQGEAGNKEYYLKLSNLGAGVVGRHHYKEEGDEKHYYPCLLTAKGLSEKALEVYIEQLIEIRARGKIHNKEEALNKIYAGVKKCVDHQSEKTGLTTALKKETKNWEADRKQGSTNCVTQSYRVSTKSRFSARLPRFFKTYEGYHSNIQDCLGQYGLDR
jgi:tetratricopeptide (TPR) repeat protein